MIALFSVSKPLLCMMSSESPILRFSSRLPALLQQPFLSYVKDQSSHHSSFLEISQTVYNHSIFGCRGPTDKAIARSFDSASPAFQRYQHSNLIKPLGCGTHHTNKPHCRQSGKHQLPGLRRLASSYRNRSDQHIRLFAPKCQQEHLCIQPAV